MPKARVAERLERVRELHRLGLSVRDIAVKVGCSRETARRDVVKLRSASETVQAAHREAVTLDLDSEAWATLRASAIASLVKSADAGSVTASVALVKLSDTQTSTCGDESHATADEVERLALDVFSTAKSFVLTVAYDAQFMSMRDLLDYELREALERAKVVLDVRYSEANPNEQRST